MNFCMRISSLYNKYIAILENIKSEENCDYIFTLLIGMFDHLAKKLEQIKEKSEKSERNESYSNVVSQILTILFNSLLSNPVSPKIWGLFR